MTRDQQTELLEALDRAAGELAALPDPLLRHVLDAYRVLRSTYQGIRTAPTTDPS